MAVAVSVAGGLDLWEDHAAMPHACGCTGTGKTLLARAAAAECGASFLALAPSSIASKWLGDGVRSVRAAFSLAAKLAPCVLFIDEVCIRGGTSIQCHTCLHHTC